MEETWNKDQKSDFFQERNHNHTSCQLSESGEARLAAPSVHRNAIGAASRAPTLQSYPSTLCLYTHSHSHTLSHTHSHTKVRRCMSNAITH